MDGFGPLLGQNYKNNNDFVVFELCSVFFSRNGKVFCKSTGGGTVYAPLEVIIITFLKLFGHLLFFGDFFKKASESII